MVASSQIHLGTVCVRQMQCMYPDCMTIDFPQDLNAEVFYYSFMVKVGMEQ